MKAPVVLVLLYTFAFLIVAGQASPDVSNRWSPEPVHFDSTPLHYVWQGPDQQVYAGGGRAENKLLRWNGTGWETLTPIPGRIHFGFTSRDGTVWFLTRHPFRGRSHRSGDIQGLWSWSPDSEAPEPVEGFNPESFTVILSTIHFHAAEDRTGRILLTNQSPTIYLIEDGRFREWHSVEPQDPANGSQSRRHWGTLYPFALPDGRIVVIGYGSSSYRVFSGYLMVDNLQVRTHSLPDFSDPYVRYSSLRFLRPDPRGPIYRSSGGHILLLDIDKGDFRELEDLPFSSERGRFEFWQQDGNNAWALFSRRKTRDTESEEYQVRLWGREGDEDWKPVSSWIHYGQHTGRFSNWLGVPPGYPFVSSSNAVWIGTADFGVIRIDPQSGEYRPLNWRHGLSLIDASWLFQLPDRQIWAGEINDLAGSGSFDPETIRAVEKPDQRIFSFPPLSGGSRWPSAQTPDGTVYELRSLHDGPDHPMNLRKWNGQSWESLTLQEFTGEPRQYLLLADKENRIWVVKIRLWNSEERPALIVDGATLERVTSGTFREFLSDYAQDSKNPGFLPGFDNANDSFFPYISPQGHILYIESRTLFAFDGEHWTRLQQSDFSDNYPDFRISRFGYIKDSGKAAVQMRGRTYQLDDTGAWAPTESPFIRVEGQRMLRELEPRRSSDRNTLDALGVGPNTRVWDLGEERHWIQDPGGRAYATFENWITPVVPENGATPLGSVEGFSAYYITGEGQRLLRVGSGWLVFPPLFPSVYPEIIVTKPTPERVLAEVADNDEIIGWRWRLNDGPWSQTARHKWLEASNLLPGSHRIDFQPLSRGLAWMNLQTVEVEVAYDPQELVREALDELMSPDWTRRNGAVHRLSIDPESAKHILQSMDPDSLSYEDQWWIEAARQAMERTAPVTNKIRFGDKPL